MGPIPGSLGTRLSVFPACAESIESRAENPSLLWHAPSHAFHPQSSRTDILLGQHTACAACP